MFGLKHQGLNNSEIARVFHTNDKQVAAVLSQIERAMGLDEESLESFRKKYEDFFTALEMTSFKQVLDCLADKEKLKKLSILQSVQVLQKVHNMRRLESNQSTSNTSVHIQLPELTEHLNQLHNKLSQSQQEDKQNQEVTIVVPDELP